MPRAKKSVSGFVSSECVMSDFFFSKIFPAIFIVAGLFFFVWGIFLYLEARESSSWPSVEGKVLSKKVDSSTSRNSDGKSETSYYPKMQYSFVVDGKTYQGSRIKVGNQSYGRYSSAQAAIADYSVKKPCMVYFNPKDPNKSVLLNGVHLFHVLFLMMGLAFIGIGTGLAFFVPYAIRQEKAKKKRLAAYQKEREERERQKELMG